MWRIPDQYSEIPKLDTQTLSWYVLSLTTLDKLEYVLRLVKEDHPENILWIPIYKEHKRLREQSNQIILVDKLIYPSYAFVGVKKNIVDIAKLATQLSNNGYGELLRPQIFPHELEQAVQVAYTMNESLRENKFKKGTNVMLTSGAFMGVTAEVVEAKKNRVLLSASMGNKEIQIEVFVTDIIKVEN